MRYFINVIVLCRSNNEGGMLKNGKNHVEVVIGDYLDLIASLNYLYAALGDG